MVTEGNACGAISWYCVKICTMYQEIATGFALAMTVRGSRSLCARVRQFSGCLRRNGTVAVPYRGFRRDKTFFDSRISYI